MTSIRPFAAGTHAPARARHTTVRPRSRLAGFVVAAALALISARLLGATAAAPGTPPVRTEAAAQVALSAYRAQLNSFRQEFGGAREMPDARFFLFGMGPRTKLLYKSGRLLHGRSGAELRRWEAQEEVILPADYAVIIRTRDGQTVVIWEDERAVWIEEGGRTAAVEGTSAPVRLPSFAGHRHAAVLRVLHQELLVNVIDGRPVPNFFAYPKPWYRDGAMMALAFKASGNLDVIRDWVLKLSEPYDRNNAGETEADNLGQALFLISLVSDKAHPLVPKILAELPKFEVNSRAGKFIRGRSDFSEHPAYQTKWLKYGLRALALPDAYAVPSVADGYSALFWMDYKDSYVKGKDADDRGDYPYLGWACDHFHGLKRSPISNRDYPLTWERNASQANYDGMKLVDPQFTQQRLCAPHTWHAAEIFLYLLGNKPVAPQ